MARGIDSLGAESLWGRWMAAGIAKKWQQCHKCFPQYSAFPSERPQVRTWGRHTCFLPQVPSNLVTPLAVRPANPPPSSRMANPVLQFAVLSDLSLFARWWWQAKQKTVCEFEELARWAPLPLLFFLLSSSLFSFAETFRSFVP